jgi:hypothetical protein
MLEKLKEYKELVTIVVFFLGGFFWLQAEFPNKSDLKAELASMRCLLDNYMKLTQLQILSQEQEKQVNELWRQLSEAPPNDTGKSGLSISPAMKVGLEKLKSEHTARTNQLRQTTSDMAQIRDNLARSVCARSVL